MKKINKILLTILTIIVFAFAAVVVWQYDNISALLNGMNKSTEDLALEIDKKRDDLKTEVEKYTNSPVIDITAEDEQKLIKGEISLEEISEKYNLPIEYMKDEEVNKDPEDIPTEIPNEIPNEVPVDNSKQIEKEIGDSVGRMYALKAKYVNKLGELEREVIDQYAKLPESKQNMDAKKELVMSNLDYIAKLEKTCDTEVGEVISSLEENLKDLGGDLKIIQILKKSYNDEKELKKSYYLSLYNE